MEIKAYFSQIGETIQHELNSAQISITAAIAWLTDPQLFEALVKATRRGLNVRIALLDDSINRRAALPMANLTAIGGQCFWIPTTDKFEGSLHHKFCVIDGRTVITGSYNWTRRASTADENIMLVQGDMKLAAGYLKAFDALLEKYGLVAAISKPVNSQVLLKRLEIIHNLLLLEDYPSLTQQLPHLEAASGYKRIPEILEAIHQQHWDKAQHILSDLIANGKALTLYESPEIAELRLSLRTLEAQVIALSTEQIETEQLIEQFSRRQNNIIGDILGQYLDLRERVYARRAQNTGKTEDSQAYQEAKEENESYQQSHDPNEGLSPLDALTQEQQDELKRLHRQANMLCHPDRVREEDKAQAQAVFNQVHQAYKNGDLETLRRLHKNLKDGKPFDDPAEIPSEVDYLRRQVARLRLEVERYIGSIQALRQSETFKTLSTLTNWDSHFTEARQQLESECEKFRAELAQDEP